MKKINYIFLMLIITINTFGQSACDNHPYGISTNPDNPTNLHSPAMTNDFFDWRISDWKDYFDPDFIASNPGSTSLPSVNPYWSQKYYLQYLSGYDAQGNFNENEIDYAPTEGWELIARGFGKTMNGEIYDEFYQPYLLMYNKYLSRLRLLFAFPQGSISSLTKTMEVTFAFENSKYRGIFGGQDGLAQPMDRPSDYSELTGIATFVADGWSHAEFDVEYDPCTCMSPTSFSVNFKGVSVGSVDMTGMFIGLDESLPMFNASNGLNGNELMTVLGKGENPVVGTETYKSIDGWIDKMKSTPPSSTGIDDIVGLIGGMIPYFNLANNIAGQFKIFKKDGDNENFYKGVQTVAKITKSANTVLKRFASTSSKPSFPSVIQGEMALSGTITTGTENEAAEFSIYNPGSAPVEDDATNEFVGPMYPIYNEVLGRFALLKTPIVHYRKGDDIDETIGVAWNSFQLDESSIEYVFNPAANVDIGSTEILAALVLNTEYLYEPIAETVNLEYLYSDNDNTKKVYISPFYPLQCLGSAGMTYEYQVDPSNLANYTDIKDTVYLRMIVKYQFNEMNRNGNPNQALQILTFPVELIEDPTPAPFFEGFANVFEGNTTISGPLSSNVYAFGTITITGPIVNTTGSPIKIIAQQIIVANGADVPNNFDLIIGLPPQCEPIEPSTIDLAEFCSSGEYKANSLSMRARKKRKEAKKLEDRRKEFRVSSFPNPFSGQFEVEYNLSQAEDTHLFIRNELGEIVFSKTFADDTKGQHFYQVDGSQFSTGIYFLTIQTESDLKTVKLIKHDE